MDRLFQAQIADALIGAGGSGQLLTRLEDLLSHLGAVPARLHLLDATGGVFYPVSGFGCETGETDLDAQQAILEPGLHDQLLHARGDPVGLLSVLNQGTYDRVGLEWLCILLGPALMSLQAQEQSQRELRQIRERMQQLTGACRLLGQFDLDILLVEILQTVQGAVGAQVGALLTREGEGPLHIRVTLGLQESHVEAIRMGDGQRLVDRVFAEGQACHLDAQALATSLDTSTLQAHLTGLLVLPLSSGRRRLGVVLLANPEAAFDQASQLLAETVCQMASIALDNALLVRSMVERERLERDLAIARQVQNDIFPNSGLVLGPLRVEGAYRPCDETGGDYFTFLEHEGHLVAMIGDVTGHGLGAALFTTAAHAIVQHAVRSGRHLASAMAALNEGLFHTQSQHDRFMTAAVVEIDPGTLVLRYASAGHNPVLWLHGQEVRWIRSNGLPLGIRPTWGGSPVPELTMAAGDVLVLYTDGFTEAMNGSDELLGEERFAAIIAEATAAGSDAKGIIDHLLAAVDTWCEQRPQTDDLTVVVVRIGP